MNAADEASAVPGVNWRLGMLAVFTLLGTGIFVALLTLQMRSTEQRDVALERQAHTYEVIIRATTLSGQIGRAEAALGRYVVSGDQRIGQQYSEAWRKAADQIDRIDRMAGEDAVQRRQIALLRDAFRARGDELAETSAYSVHHRNADALGKFYAVSESDALQALTDRLRGIIDYQRVQLAERSEALARSNEHAVQVSQVLAAFGILIVLGAIILGWLTVQAINDRAAADADATDERVRSAELEQAVSVATERLRAEAREREEAEAQLRQAQKMEAVGQLTGGIAHDFNNMLAVVLGGLELARRHLQTGGRDAQRHIENAMEGANRAAALTRRLLAFSRSEPVLPEAVDPDALVSGMSDLLDRTLGDGIAIETRHENRGWSVWVDRHQLENAILNLAVNARDAMEGRGSLTVATGGGSLSENEVGRLDAGDYVTIAVTDDGAGMPPEVLDRVFEPFFTTKPAGKGTGLGLSQIFGFVRQSGGDVAIRTAPGAGTTVTLYLPRYEGEATPAAVAIDSAPAAAEQSLAILVVEDDPRVLSATIGALTELGHRPVACEDPLRAPELLDRMEALDLILSDVLMPGQTGPEMIAANSDRIGDAPILYVTGFAGEMDAADFEGHPVLRKPFTLASLQHAIDEATRGAAPGGRRHEAKR
ncbi:ATP-binding protein [Stakelama tenebrarum]|uniref:histidine kinase n=1 Tax=Stakelama tenebrarum TaxID=2711215 RepID=A0A6G6Y4L5_9SPHN|nr:ATP-binding protein [Sphingosinithalassobacter tenebrarum]QIG79839.1 response regulator [Sphingosinithalassobacter tenebrarum]